MWKVQLTETKDKNDILVQTLFPITHDFQSCYFKQFLPIFGPD